MKTREEKFLRFTQCELCNYDLMTGEGERGCHYYDCPNLPEELDVRCPICLFNFAIGDGNPDCSYPPSCDFAREVAPTRVANLVRWMAARAERLGAA